MKRPQLLLAAAGLALAVLSGCASRPAAWDYTAFQQAKPASLLVMPPVNDSPEVKATASVWSHATRPLAEAGYYVLPVTLVDETLRSNGVMTAQDAQDIPLPKLREFFGADAAVYIRIKDYGTRYAVLSSETRVQVEGQVVDLRTGTLLWKGSAAASSAEQQQQSQGGLVGLLVQALVQQIVGTVSDAAYNYAGIASYRLMGTPRFNGMLPGPRSPDYGKPLPSQ
ncbi:MAG: DUF799 domain-containing protein [Aquabacterium sp.]|nr:DUF799 domain-containing protein [Aquabacterium sp.]